MILTMNMSNMRPSRKEVGNFVLGNTEYKVYKVTQAHHKYCIYTHEDNTGYGYTNFADEDVYNLSDEEVTVRALKSIMNVQKFLQSIEVL